MMLSVMLVGSALWLQTSHRIYNIFPEFQCMQCSRDYNITSVLWVNDENPTFRLFETDPPGIGSGARIDSGTGPSLGSSIYPSLFEDCPQEMLTLRHSHVRAPFCVPRCATGEALGPKVKVTRDHEHNTVSTMEVIACTDHNQFLQL